MITKGVWLNAAALFLLADPYAAQREKMVREQIEARGIQNAEVLHAMRSVPRHSFVPERLRQYAYSDQPLPIGLGQTISQPYIVALMTELLAPGKKDRVLEIGTGSGYQAAVLAMIARHVYTIEIVPDLAKSAGECLMAQGHRNISVRQGDGYKAGPSKLRSTASFSRRRRRRFRRRLLISSSRAASWWRRWAICVRSWWCWKKQRAERSAGDRWRR